MRLRRSVGIAPTARDGRRVLLQRKDASYHTFPRAYSFYGGGLERGESAREGMLRELEEELGAGVAARLREGWRVAFEGRVAYEGRSFEFTLFEVQRELAELEDIARQPVYEGEGSVLTSPEAMLELPFVWGLEAVAAELARQLKGRAAPPDP